MLLVIISGCKRAKSSDEFLPASESDTSETQEKQSENNSEKNVINTGINETQPQVQAQSEEEKPKEYKVSNPINKKIIHNYGIVDVLTMHISPKMPEFQVKLLTDKNNNDEKLDTSLIFKDLQAYEITEEKWYDSKEKKDYYGRRFTVKFKKDNGEIYSVEEILEILNKLESYDYVAEAYAEILDGGTPNPSFHRFSKKHSYEQLKKLILAHSSKNSWVFDDDKKTITYKAYSIEPVKPGESIKYRYCKLNYTDLI